MTTTASPDILVHTEAGVRTITLNRAERKNPLTFDSYAELRDWFLGLQRATDIKTVVVTGAGGTIVLDEYAVLNERRIPGRIEGTVIAYLNCIVLETSEEYHRYLSVLESIGFVRQTEDAAVATAGREGLTCPICSNS